MIKLSKESMKYWNVGVDFEEAATAYRYNNRLESDCFIFFDAKTPLNISDMRIVDGALHLTLNAIRDLPQNVSRVDVVNGHLIAYIGSNQEERSVDLGRVVGNDGITPTFTIENGHLFADYDNPYRP